MLRILLVLDVVIRMLKLPTGVLRWLVLERVETVDILSLSFVALVVQLVDHIPCLIHVHKLVFLLLLGDKMSRPETRLVLPAGPCRPTTPVWCVRAPACHVVGAPEHVSPQQKTTM